MCVSVRRFQRCVCEEVSKVCVCEVSKVCMCVCEVRVLSKVCVCERYVLSKVCMCV